MIQWRLLGSLTLALVMATGGLAFAATSPTDQLKQYSDQVIKVLEDPALRGDDKRRERRAAVRRVAIEIFDVEESARRTLGRHWQGRTPEERREFVELFADLLERTYIGRIDEYGGERLQYTDEQVEGDRAIVRARIITRRGTEIPVEARMLWRNDRWYMYDVLIEQLSLVSYYRAQFDRIIRTGSYQDLVQRLRDRSGDGVPAPPPTQRSSR